MQTGQLLHREDFTVAVSNISKTPFIRTSMTRTFSEAISEKATPKSSGRRPILAMFKANHGLVRPRRNSAAWAISKRANRPDKMTISNVMQEYPFDTEYNHDYIPLRVSRINKPANDKKRAADKLRTSGKSMLKYFREYCEGSTLHGLRYVGIEGATIFERIFWIIAFIGAIGFSAFFISNIYDKWVYTPIIVGINPEFKSITEIPFPAVTICNMNQARKTVAEQVMAGNNEAEKEILADICNVNGTQNNSTDSSSSNWEFIKAFMLKVSQPCNKLFVNCKWQGYKVPCEHIINAALTDEGVCCTFNRVASKYMYHNPWILADFNIHFPDNNIDWTPEDGYPANTTNDTWPYRAAGPGVHLGLSLVVNVAADDYYCSSTNSVGLKIRLHSPVETPMMADYGFLIHPRKEVRIAIRPTMDEASPTINSIPIDKRQCYFSEEKDLYFYRTYTKMNCDLECLSNYTVTRCGCVPFYLPKNVNTTICDKKKEYCYQKAKTDMDLYHRPSILCSCLPACYEITYTQDHSLGDISKPELRNADTNTTDLLSLIVLNFFYQQTQFRSYQKSELFGFTEFLSNSGGLLGLFLGFSFLSAVEIGYHLTLRLWCVYYRKHRAAEHDTVVYPFAQ